MFAGQFKSKFIVIKIIPELIHPIMTFEAIIPKRNLVIHHEGHIHTDMAFTTGQLIKLRDIIPMTIGAQEGFILSC